MAFITLQGTLLDPNGSVSIGDELRFTHKSTTGSTLKSAVTLMKITTLGNYYIDLQYGLVLVEYKDVKNNQFENLGVVTVNQDSTATTLPELLNAVVPPTNAQLLEFQAILADCVSQVTLATTQAVRSETAASISEAFANQLTTTELIASTSVYAADVVLLTSGFSVSGSGSGSWKQNGITGQIPSQSPAQIINGLLNDGNGNQWELVSENPTPEMLGAVTGGLVDDTLPIRANIKMLAEGAYSKGVTFKKGVSYLFYGFVIDGNIYSGYTQNDVKSRFAQNDFDYETREYIDGNLFIWRLQLRAGNQALSQNAQSFNKATFDAAIALGTLKITFVGTSITRGENAQAERLNNWVQMFLEDLKIKYPNVDIVSVNLGIDGRRIEQYIDPTYVGQASMPVDPEDGWFYTATNDSWQNGTALGVSWEDQAEATQPDMLVINFGMNSGASDDQTFSDDLNTAITNAQSWTSAPTIALVSEVSPNQDEIASYSTIRKFSRLTRFTANKSGYPLLDAGRYQRYAEGGIDDTRCRFKRIDSTIGISDWRFSFSAPTTQGINSVSKGDTTPSVVLKDGEYNAIRATFTFSPAGVGSQAFITMGTNSNVQQYNTDSIWVWRETNRIRVMGTNSLVAFSAVVPNNVSSAIVEEIDARIVNNHVIVYIDNVKYVDFFVTNNGADGGVGIGIANGINTNIVIDIGAPYQLSPPLLDKRGLYGEVGGGVSEDGGNGINHPARLAYEYVWRPAITDFIRGL